MELKNKNYVLYATEYDGIEYDSIEFTQNDTNNSQLDLIMPYEADEVVLTVVKPSSEEIVARFPKVDSNTNFSLELDSDLINESGTYKATVQAYGHDYDRRTVGTFKYKIATEVNSNSIPTDDRVPILTSLISDVNSLYEKVIDADNGEGGRIIAEEERVNNEIARQINEANREKNMASWNDFKANGGEIGGNVTLPMIRFKNNLETAGIRQNGNDMIFSTNGLDKFFMNQWQFRPNSGNSIDLGAGSLPFKDIYLSGYSKSPNGYTKLPNGMIMQWGVYTVALPLVDTSYHDIFLPVTHVSGTLNADITIHCKGVNNIPIPIALNLYQVLNNKLQIRMRAFESAGISELKVYWKTIGY